MAQILYPVLALGILGTLVVVVWRFAADRTSVPCPAWLAWLVELDNPVFRNDSARSILQHLALEQGMHVLDLGCGPGRLTIPVAKQVGPSGRVTAFDIQEQMLERNRAKARAEELANIRYVQGGAGQGRLERGAYDRVLLVTVLGEIPHKDAAVREIFDALKPGGIWSVTEVIADPHFQSRASVRRRAAAAGFVEKNCFGNALSYTINFGRP